MICIQYLQSEYLLVEIENKIAESFCLSPDDSLVDDRLEIGESCVRNIAAGIASEYIKTKEAHRKKEGGYHHPK